MAGVVTDSSLMVLAKELSLFIEDYYVAKSSNVSDYIDEWQKRGNKVYEDSMPVMIDVSKLWPHREYTWDREQSRSGYARVDGKKADLPGELKWDAMKVDLKKNGWDKDEPLYFEIGRSGGAKVGEGNHRLAISRDVGIKKVPVFFVFKHGKVTKSKQGASSVDVAKSAIRDVVKKDKKKPEKRQEYRRGDDPDMDDLLDLLL